MQGTPTEFPKKTIAAIDIGTNSAHMVIADMDHVGEMRVRDTDKVTLRLGQAIDAHGNLTEDGIRRTVEALSHMQEIIAPYKARVRAVATHATREARNHRRLLQEIERVAGIKVDMIDGIEEARLVFLGMRYGLVLANVPCLAVDVGGGSTEIIIAKDDAISFVSSFKLGAVTLTDKYFNKLGYSSATVKALREHVRSRLSPLPKETERLSFSQALASSGTAKALAFLHARMFASATMNDPNGYILPRDDLFKIVDSFGKQLTPQKIKEATGLDQSRAEIIYAGAIILEEVTRLLKVKEWVITSYGLREGLVADTFYRTYGGRSRELPDIQWHSVLTFARRLNIDSGHAQHVTSLAVRIYQLLTPLTMMTLSDEEHDANHKLLKAAAYLRESGKFLSAPQYHKHSQYLITHSRLPGFTEPERTLMGLIARFQRKGVPSANHEDCKDLSGAELKRLRLLSGIVRLAAALDRTRQMRVKTVDLTSDGLSLQFALLHDGDALPEVELHKARLEGSALERSFERKVSFQLRSL